MDSEFLCVSKDKMDSAWRLGLLHWDACLVHIYQSRTNTIKSAVCTQDPPDVGSAEWTHRVCVLTAESRSQRGTAGPMGEDGTSPRGRARTFPAIMRKKEKKNNAVFLFCRHCWCFSCLKFSTGSYRSGRVCGGSAAAGGQCVCQRHTGPFPSPPGVGLWSRGRSGRSVAGNVHA